MMQHWLMQRILVLITLSTFLRQRGEVRIGICMENIPDDLRYAISRCTVIIAKGMANFESLSEMDNLPPVAYMMAAKCKPVADEIGVPVGSKIALLRA